MWIRQLLLAVIGLSAGVAVAGGVFSLIVSIGVIPRFIDKTHTGMHIKLYEDCVTLGGSLGSLVSVYSFKVPLGIAGLFLYGIFSGIFVGCLAMALAEILNVFPIYFRRLRITQGAGVVILFMALGKLVGALLCFIERW